MMNRNLKTISALRNPWILTLLFFPFFKPLCIPTMAPLVDTIIDGWKVFSIFVILIILIRCHMKISKIILLISIYQFIALFSTFINSGSYWDLMLSAGSIISFSILIEICLYYDFSTMLKSLDWILTMLCIVNLITIIAFPDGLYTDAMGKSNGYYFLGLDNIHSMFILPLLCVKLLRLKPESSLLHTAIILIIFSLSVYLTWSATAVVAISVFIMLIVMYKMKITPRILNINCYYFLIFISFLGVVVFRWEEAFSYIIENILGKSLQLSGRTYLWDHVFLAIQKKPFLGYGILSQGQMLSLLGNSHCHSLFLQVIFQCGYIGLILYIIILFSIIKPLQMYKNTYSGYVLSAVVFAYLINFLVETQSYHLPFYGVLVMAYHIKIIADQTQTKSRGKLE